MHLFIKIDILFFLPLLTPLTTKSCCSISKWVEVYVAQPWHGLGFTWLAGHNLWRFTTPHQSLNCSATVCTRATTATSLHLPQLATLVPFLTNIRLWRRMSTVFADLLFSTYTTSAAFEIKTVGYEDNCHHCPGPSHLRTWLLYLSAMLTPSCTHKEIAEGAKCSS